MGFKVQLKQIGSSAKIQQGVRLLTAREVLAGVPANTAPRKGDPINNATLLYIHDQGSPARGIPQREVLRPGIRDAKVEIVARLQQGARLALNGDKVGVEKALTAAGLIAQKSIRQKINTGPFTPLKPATLAARRRRGRTGTKPLIDTGALRQAINFVVVDKKK